MNFGGTLLRSQHPTETTSVKLFLQSEANLETTDAVATAAERRVAARGDDAVAMDTARVPGRRAQRRRPDGHLHHEHRRRANRSDGVSVTSGGADGAGCPATGHVAQQRRHAEHWRSASGVIDVPD